jgi:DNA-binding response OmpR family regulator
MTHIITLSCDKELRRFIKKSLETEAIKVSHECSSLKETVEMYRNDQVPIMIVDLFIPESSGIESIKHLKKMNENLIVILLSRMRNKALMEKAFRFGADDVLVLPVSADTLRETVLHRIRNVRVTEVHFETT